MTVVALFLALHTLDRQSPIHESDEESKNASWLPVIFDFLSEANFPRVICEKRLKERESWRERNGDFCAVIFFFSRLISCFQCRLATQEVSFQVLLFSVIFGNCSGKFATARDEREE